MAKTDLIGAILCIILIPVFGAIIIGVVHVFYDNEEGSGEGLRQVIYPRVNSALCQAYTVTTIQSADFYLIPKNEKPSSKYDVVDSQGYKFPTYFNKNRFFYLLKGSKMKISVCRKRRGATRGDVEILLYTGIKCEWSVTKNKGSCPAFRKLVNFCDQSKTVLDYVVPRTDRYYVTINFKTDRKGDLRDIQADLELQRANFVTGKARKKCSTSQKCKIRTDGDVDILIKFADGDKDTTFKGVCEKRVGTWVGIGFGTFAILIGIAAVSLCCRKK